MTEGGRASTYGYDLNGNIVQKKLQNGDSEVESYDALNRSVSQVASNPTATPPQLYTYNYGYDLVGNVTSVGESYPSGLNNRTVTNSYDVIDRLLTETVTGSAPNVTTTYAYDAANNRSSMAVAGGSAPGTTTYTYNSLNQPTSYTNGTRSVALGYDLDGNRITRTVTGGTDNGSDTYSYDFENRLIGLVKGSGGGGAGTYAYQYDYRTRRIIRDETQASGVLTTLVYSGGTSVQDSTGTTPALSVEYIRGSDYGGGVGGILYTLRSGTPSYTHANHRGDVVAKTNASGGLTFQAQYEGFGKQIATSGSTLDRQQANSKDVDPTGLKLEGYRYYDLEADVFTTRDPKGTELMMGKDHWIVDGREVSYQEYQYGKTMVFGFPVAAPTGSAKETNDKQGIG
jgi:YD repeat-containing protein